MFPEPTELLLMDYSTQSTWTPKSKSNTLTPITNSQTFWHREISHVMNGIIFSVCSTSAIQSHQLSWSDVEKNARRCRWRKSHSKIEADDEFSLVMQRKDSWRACLYCIRKSRENQTWKSISSKLANWAASQNWTNQAAQNGMLIKLGFLKSGNLGQWSSAKETEPIFKRCNKRQRQTLCDMGYVCLLHYKHLYPWWRITQTITLYQ